LVERWSRKRQHPAVRKSGGPTEVAAVVVGRGGPVSREFLGRGWSFPVTPREDGGGIRTTDTEQNIVECIHLILHTTPGERPMLPDFGCPLSELVFRTNSAQTRHDAESMVRAALHKWEPRIDVRGVVARPDPANQNRMRLHIDYVVRKSNNHQNLVHLLDLQRFYDAD
jgi:phage baseplate assembly protein W